MRYLIFILAVAALATGCTSTKQVTVTPKATAVTEKKKSSPEFIDNVVIEGNKKTPASGNSSGTSYKTNNTSPVLVANTEVVDAPIENFSALRMKYSILLNIPVEELTNDKMLAFIEDWYGTKYRFGGDDKRGIDCSAFVQLFMTTMYGYSMPRMAKDQYLQTYRINRDDLKEGDLVFFHTTRRGISHVGIYLANNKFVHASTAGGVVVSDMTDGYYNDHFVCGGRVRNFPISN